MCLSLLDHRERNRSQECSNREKKERGGKQGRCQGKGKWLEQSETGQGKPRVGSHDASCDRGRTQMNAVRHHSSMRWDRMQVWGKQRQKSADRDWHTNIDATRDYGVGDAVGQRRWLSYLHLLEVYTTQTKVGKEFTTNFNTTQRSWSERNVNA